MKKIDFNPIPLEEYLTFNTDSRRKAFRFINMKGYPRPRSEKEMMNALAKIRRAGDEEDIITLAKMHPDYDLIKYCVLNDLDNESKENEQTSNCSGKHSNCGGCGATSSFNALENVMGLHGDYRVGGAINGEMDGTWITSANGMKYYMANGSKAVETKQTDDKKFYTTLVIGTAMIGLFIVALKSMK